MTTTATTTATGRTVGLARANSTLLVRNRLTLSYALAFPLLPLGFVLAGDGTDDRGWVAIASSCLLTALLFSVFYSVLSMVVTRRDELVLKRLRTGEARDGEILLAMVLPGAVVVLVVAVLVGAVGAPLGLPLPANPVLLLGCLVLGTACFAALAFWTASWTSNAEAAQLTSLPVFVLALLGPFADALPTVLADVAQWTPGAAVKELVGLGWVGLDADGPVSLAASWGAALPSLGVLAAWTVAAVVLAGRSMRWEPRA